MKFFNFFTMLKVVLSITWENDFCPILSVKTKVEINVKKQTFLKKLLLVSVKLVAIFRTNNLKLTIIVIQFFTKIKFLKKN